MKRYVKKVVFLLRCAVLKTDYDGDLLSLPESDSASIPPPDCAPVPEDGAVFIVEKTICIIKDDTKQRHQTPISKMGTTTMFKGAATYNVRFLFTVLVLCI